MQVIFFFIITTPKAVYQRECIFVFKPDEAEEKADVETEISFRR